MSFHRLFLRHSYVVCFHGVRRSTRRRSLGESIAVCPASALLTYPLSTCSLTTLSALNLVLDCGPSTER
eukprot:21323-Eustigmatos_ZCMA.PRE.1